MTQLQKCVVNMSRKTNCQLCMEAKPKNEMEENPHKKKTIYD